MRGVRLMLNLRPKLMLGQRSHAALSGAVIALLVSVGGGVSPVAAQQSDADPSWQPMASERLVRMPAGYLERAIEQDYRESDLARAIEETGSELQDRSQSLGALQDAASRADGPARDELRHHALVEKRSYVDTMERRLSLERKRLDTRVELLEGMLDRLSRSEAFETEADLTLKANREAAFDRFEASRPAIDMAILKGGAVEESRYATEYRKHADALSKLASAIERHPMNEVPANDGRPLDRREHLHHLLTAAQTERAILEQRETVVAYMAKLVALDAMAFSDEMAERDMVERGRPEERDLTLAVDAFIRN
jgi:hypothetical protein